MPIQMLAKLKNYPFKVDYSPFQIGSLPGVQGVDARAMSRQDNPVLVPPIGPELTRRLTTQNAPFCREDNRKLAI